jgi:hypothetical protein
MVLSIRRGFSNEEKSRLTEHLGRLRVPALSSESAAWIHHDFGETHHRACGNLPQGDKTWAKLVLVTPSTSIRAPSSVENYFLEPFNIHRES